MLRIALAGCPNSGKTSIFNLLTGSFQRIANYPGVTVSMQVGWMHPAGLGRVEVLDLPGCYGLSGGTEEQALPADLLQGRLAAERRPDLVVCILDACQFKQQLPLALELRTLGLPMILVLNQSDVATRRGVSIDMELLARRLGIPTVWSVAVRRSGIAALQKAIEESLNAASAKEGTDRIGVREERPPLKASALCAEVLQKEGREDGFGRRLDALLLHPVLGPVALLGTLFLVFQAVFTWSALPSEWIGVLMETMIGLAATHLPAGPLSSLVGEGILPGVGAVMEFLPPILLLSFFLLLLEASGYISRLAFLCDTLLARVGLGGHAVFPFLSGFACAIPAIMSARSIPDTRARMAAILAMPLVPCSARLPVYALVIAAVIPAIQVAGFNLQGLVLFALYIVGLLCGVAVAALISWRTGADTSVPMELPSYRLPIVRNLLFGLWVRAKHFLRRAGTVILGISVLLWLLAEIRIEPGDGLSGSLIGWLGNLLHPVFVPLGFTWEMTVALIPGLVAREVAVSALATVHALDGGGEAGLASLLSESWSVATGLAFAAWYIFAPQCIATLGVIRAETGSWKPALLVLAYLFALAWLVAFGVYQGTSALF